MEVKGLESLAGLIFLAIFVIANAESHQVNNAPAGSIGSVSPVLIDLLKDIITGIAGSVERFVELKIKMIEKHKNDPLFLIDTMSMEYDIEKFISRDKTAKNFTELWKDVQSFYTKYLSTDTDSTLDSNQHTTKKDINTSVSAPPNYDDDSDSDYDGDPKILSSNSDEDSDHLETLLLSAKKPKPKKNNKKRHKTKKPKKSLKK